MPNEYARRFLEKRFHKGTRSELQRGFVRIRQQDPRRKNAVRVHEKLDESGDIFMEAKLEILEGADRGVVFVLRGAGVWLAGRSPRARLRFSDADPYISRKHFLLESAPPKIYFRDLDVTNPSAINGVRVEETELKDGDVIEVGYTRLKVALRQEEADTEERTTEALDESVAARVGKGPGGPFEARCACGKDLSKKADSDGRARELAGKVRHCCAGCLPPGDRNAGRRINDYEVIRQLGKGGMGRVYLVYQPATARLAAMKVINIANRQAGARFNREIRIMKDIFHENVLCYIDSGQDEETHRPYLVMEYVSGGSLDERLMKRRQGVSPRLAVLGAVHSLKGLEYVHARGIVHRDIKPANILLKDMGGRYIPKLADFGLARRFSRAGGSVLTRLGVSMGTLLYMPPEQILDAHNVREPADIYSMGVTLYHLLTGRYPFVFPTPADIALFLEENRDRARNVDDALQLMMRMQRIKSPHLIILEEKPIPVRNNRRDLPADLAAVVDKAIRQDVDERFSSATELRTELEKVYRRHWSPKSE